MLALTESMFYYFLVDIDGSPHSQAVLTTFDPNRHVGELLELEDGSEVRVRGIEVSVEAHIAGRGFDGVLVVESQDSN